MSVTRPVLSPIVISQLRRRPWSRRRALAFLGGVAGGAVLAGCGGGGSSSVAVDDDDDVITTTPGTDGTSCAATPSATEGPFFVDENLNRADIRPNTSGVAEPSIANATPLYLSLSVYNATANACTPVPDVQLDIWHCHAGGLYSDVSSGQSTNTTGKDFLRGYQVTDASGNVRFTTIYPGWYAGRTVHIHIKARLYDAGSNRTTAFNTQGFFDDGITDAVMANAPYNTRGARTTRNANDNIYGGQTALLFALTQNADGSYNGSLSIGLAL
jgi:protocatechuate 3,4-dioxygenase beta subunit